jgi:SAM-dependent methyltransferase
MTTKTTERIDPEQWFASREEYLLYLRHEFAYEFARTLIPPGSHVLEVGSGEGYGTAKLAGTAGRVTGLDVDESTVARASERYGSDKVKFKAYSGLSMPFGAGSFDAAVSFQVIEHVADVPSFVAEIRRVLKPDGPLVLTTPNRAYRLKPGQKPWNRFHLREYSADDLAAVLKANFKDISIWGVRGTDEVQAIEHARVAWGKGSGPVSALRRVMPESLRRVAGSVLKLKSGRRAKGEPDFRTKFSIADYSVIKEQVEQSLDLLAVCRA